MKGLFSVAAFALVLHSAGLAYAVEESSEPTPAQVRSAAEAFDRGREAYKADDYVEAAEQFESADANAPSAAALELAIRARDKAGQLDRAATLAALALARHPDDPNIQKIAPPIVERAKAELFELDLKCDEACDVTVGGKITPGRRATDRTLFLAPGHYNVRAGWSGDRSSSKSVDGNKGETGSLEFSAPQVAPTAPVVVPVTPPPPEKPADDGAQTKSGKLPKAVFWVGVGVTGVLAGTTLWSGIDTQNNPGPDRVRDACKTVDSSGNHSAECDSLYNQGLDKQHRTNLLLGLSAGVGVATAVVGAFFTDWGGAKKSDAEQAKKAPARGISVQPWVAIGSGASVGALGRF
jgi:hypothetical protein